MNSKQIFTFLIFIIIIGCKQNEKNLEPESIVQDKFVEFIKKSCVAYQRQQNDIQRREYLNEYEKNIVSLSDSIGILNNWEGRITELKTFDWSSLNSTELTVEIEIKISEYQKLTFKSKRLFGNKVIDSNLVYRQLRDLRIGTIVYFDGFLSKSKDNEIVFDSFSFNDNKNICNPEIQFNLISIGKEKLNFTSSENFNKIKNFQLETWKVMDDLVTKQINEKQFEEKLTDFKKELEPIISTLSTEEKDYVKSFTNCLASEFYKK